MLNIREIGLKSNFFPALHGREVAHIGTKPWNRFSDVKLYRSFLPFSWFTGHSIQGGYIITFLPTNTGCSKKKTV